jgi:hypothetical protein
MVVLACHEWVQKDDFGKALDGLTDRSTEVYTILHLMAMICANHSKTPGQNHPKGL